MIKNQYRSGLKPITFYQNIVHLKKISNMQKDDFNV